MRRDWLVLSACVAILAGCGGGDDESSDGATTATDPATTTAAAGRTFKAADVGFTFTYPDGFEQIDEPGDGEALATVTLDPNDVKNALKIRETAAQELEFNTYSATIKAQFEDQLDTTVTQDVDNHNGIDVGILTWKTEGLESTNYFFGAGGKTWQLECLSTASHRAAIDAACAQALDTIEPAAS